MAPKQSVSKLSFDDLVQCYRLVYLPGFKKPIRFEESDRDDVFKALRITREDGRVDPTVTKETVAFNVRQVIEEVPKHGKNGFLMTKQSLERRDELGQWFDLSENIVEAIFNCKLILRVLVSLMRVMPL